MSGKISGGVWDCALSHNDKLVLLAYADHADHEGYNVRPSYDLIAWKTGFTRRGIIQITHKLEAMGILKRVKTGGPDKLGGGNRANEWFIDLESAPKTPSRLKKVVHGPSLPQTDVVHGPSLPVVHGPSPDPSSKPSEESLPAGAGVPEIPQSKPRITQPLWDAIARYVQHIDPIIADKPTAFLLASASRYWKKKLGKEHLTADEYQMIADTIEPFIREYLACEPNLQWIQHANGFYSWYSKLLPVVLEEKTDEPEFNANGSGVMIHQGR
jgi:hypothetical protein